MARGQPTYGYHAGLQVGQIVVMVVMMMMLPLVVELLLVPFLWIGVKYPA